jgi:hypothetical protein
VAFKSTDILLLADILLDHFTIHTNGANEISAGPNVEPPIPFPKRWELLSQTLSTLALEHFHDLGWRILGRSLLERERSKGRDALLQKHGFAADPGKIISVEDQSLATESQVAGSFIGRFLTLFLVMLMLTGGSVASMDIIAGEKERGSLETILTTAVKRTEVVAAKQLTILTVALTITMIQTMAVTVLILFIPVAAFISAVLLMLSTYAKSYKVAQLYFFPVYLVSWVPSLAAVLPGISLCSAIAVP